MPISLISISKFYSGEEKLIQRAENALNSGRLLNFTYDGTTGVIRATVGASMKKRSYTVMVGVNPHIRGRSKITSRSPINY